jgi:imidazolonepropionase
MADGQLLTGCKQLVTMAGPAPRRGRALGEIGLVENGAVLIEGGRIVAAGPRAKVESHATARRARHMDLGGRVVTPGLVDAHTHLVFAASRAGEYEQRIAGATYEQIAKAGGGILSSVRALRAASDEALASTARARLARMAAHGTTTTEAKTGYGLDFDNEVRTLKLLRRLGKEQMVEIVPTLLAAHVVPPEFRSQNFGTGGADEYVDRIVRLFLPAVALEGLAEYCDVFVERGAFSVPQARRIFAAARALGLKPRLHAEQLARTGGARLSVEVEAASVDHLDFVSGADIRALARSEVACILLPGCSFHLGLGRYAPARRLIEAGAIVGLATDCNPGTSPTLSLPMAMSLACTQMRMAPAEALAACTINAAYSLGRHARTGSIEVGKDADLAVFDVEDYREIPYYFGVNHCVMTVKRGRIIYKTMS